MATPAGDLELGRAPRSAAGPDLRQLILGSEGAFGVITSMRLRVRRLPAERRWDAWRFPSFEAGRDAMRALAQERRLPSVIRLSDETETMINGGSGCLMVIGYEKGDPRASPAPSTWAPDRPSAGPTAASPPPTCVTPSSGPGRPWRPWRPRPTGRACPGSTRP